MKIEITAGGIYNAKGEEIPVGTELTVKNEPTAWAGRYRIIGGEAKAKGEGEVKTAVTNPAKFEAKAKGEGEVTQWFIVDGKGKEIGKPVSEADAKAFNDLSDADKAAFAAEHGKA